MAEKIIGSCFLLKAIFDYCEYQILGIYFTYENAGDMLYSYKYLDTFPSDVLL